MPRMSSLYAVALAYLAAGGSVVPTASGAKAPSVVDPKTGQMYRFSWERYQHVRASPGEVRRWTRDPHHTSMMPPPPPSLSIEPRGVSPPSSHTCPKMVSK